MISRGPGGIGGRELSVASGRQERNFSRLSLPNLVQNSHHPKLRMTPGRDTAPGFFVRPRQQGGESRHVGMFHCSALFFIVIADAA
jgi:hypothetical protein